jgi:hypothetical protein
MSSSLPVAVASALVATAFTQAYNWLFQQRALLANLTAQLDQRIEKEVLPPPPEKAALASPEAPAVQCVPGWTDTTLLYAVGVAFTLGFICALSLVCCLKFCRCRVTPFEKPVEAQHSDVSGPLSEQVKVRRASEVDSESTPARSSDSDLATEASASRALPRALTPRQRAALLAATK